MSTHPQNVSAVTPLTDAALDAALGSEQDAILPSSGFTDAVMAAIKSEAPAPIPFPWKRAWPLFAAAPVAFALVIAGFVALVRTVLAQPIPAASAGNAGPLFGIHVAALLHDPAGNVVFWIGVSLAIPLFCLAIMRRMLPGR